MKPTSRIQHLAANCSGYIAITTAIVLSVVVLAVALSLGSSAIFTRAQILDAELKKLSYSVARSCLDASRLQLALDPNYSGNATTTVSNYQCHIEPIETSGSNKIIKAKAQIGAAVTNLRLTVNGSTLSTIQLEELSSF